jgi:transcriptional regulator with XRE-family HTH domain
MRRMDTNTIGWRLDKAMQDARIKSQAALARASGVPQPTINRILNSEGKSGPELNTLIALAGATGVELLWLQTGQGPQFPGSSVNASSKAHPVESTQLRAVEPVATTTLQWVTDREAELLSEFRACAEPQKNRLLTSARALPKSETIVAARNKTQSS